MPLNDYRKWVLSAIIIVSAGIVVFSYITSMSDREESRSRAVAKQPRVSTAPLIDSGTALSQMQMENLPEDPAYLARLGDQYFESNNYEQAIKIYLKVIELNPNDADTYNDLGLAYYYTRKTREAINSFRKGAEVNPSFQRIWLSLGFVLMSSGDNAGAREALEKAVDAGPDTEVGMEAKRMIGLLKK